MNEYLLKIRYNPIISSSFFNKQVKYSPPCILNQRNTDFNEFHP